MPTAIKFIEKVVLGSDAATVTIGSGGTIPQTYDDLLVLISSRSTPTPSELATEMYISINGSTSNFSGRVLYGNGSSAGSFTTTRWVGSISSANTTANTFGPNEIYIPNYRGSTNKSLSVTNSTENNGTTAYPAAAAVLWANTAAITSLSFSSNVGNIASGSSFYLYGITKA